MLGQHQPVVAGLVGERGLVQQLGDPLDGRQLVVQVRLDRHRSGGERRGRDGHLAAHRPKGLFGWKGTLPSRSAFSASSASVHEPPESIRSTSAYGWYSRTESGPRPAPVTIATRPARELIDPPEGN